MQRLRESTEVIVIHAIGMALAIVAMWIVHCLLKFTSGENAKLFDCLPIAYVCHLGDLLAMLRFCWMLAKEF